MKLYLLVSIFLILTGVITHGQNTYNNSDHKFIIDFPDNCVIKKSSQKFTLIKAVSNQNNHISYISIAAYPIPNRDLDYYMNITPTEMYLSLKGEYQNFLVERLNSGVKIIEGKRAIWTELKVTISDNISIITSNYHIVHNGWLFRITNSTDGGNEFYNQLKPVFNKSSYSIKFY